MEINFDGKHVLVTGGGRGIGYAIASQFANSGAKVTIWDNQSENLSQEDCEFMSFQQVDISDFNAVTNAVDELWKEQPVDVLINNAGVAYESSFLDLSQEEWAKVLDINLTGTFYVSQQICKKMVQRKQGVVLNMSSKNGLDGEVGYAHYNASKAGIIGLTKTMALELASSGIRVNAVCPGYIETPMSKEIDDPAFTMKFVEQYIPLNRAGCVEDVAPMFLFLASPYSAFITGQSIVIDGGQLAGQKPWNGLLENL
tara:strand:- start:226 stop:993 length:768 start_codon:yes stop_codon:yes gene_type:complete